MHAVVAFAWVTIPIIGWLLDKKGYGWTLGSINALAVLTSVLQALPVLQIQASAAEVWHRHQLAPRTWHFFHFVPPVP